MGVRSSRGSGGDRAQPALGKREPERSSGGAACPPGASAAASAGARPGPSAASACLRWHWPLPSASQALRVFLGMPDFGLYLRRAPPPHTELPFPPLATAPSFPRPGPQGTLH